ncbi:tetratricopeptide repeat protein, partial [bacterium]
MTLVRALAHCGVAGLLVVCALTGEERPTAPAQGPAPAQTDVVAGHRHYFAGRPADAIKSYQAALRREPEHHEAWINGAVVWDSLGEPEKAAAWYRRALKAKPGDAPAQTALGELELRRGRLGEARAELDKALALSPEDPSALIARGRTSLAMGRLDEAVATLKKAAAPTASAPIASFWLGNAFEEAGRHEEAAAAFDRAARADSYFSAARYRLARSLARLGRVREALDELAKLLDADPGHEDYKRLQAALRPRLKDAPRMTPRQPPPAAWTPPARAADPAVPVAPLPPTGRVPVLRVGVGTTALGKPVDWRGVWAEGTEGFELVEGASGRRVVRAAAGERWELRPTSGKHAGTEAVGPTGTTLRVRGAVALKPAGKGTLWLREKWPGAPGRFRGLERRLRGVVELAPYKQGLKVVNVVDLESYTHGVLSAEMPVDSPMEALKAQAVLARTHALYMRGVTSRHKGDGYELCDGQHCQVYSGLRSESARSRAVVEGTRGRIVTFEGRPTNVLYSANCGGHAQGAGEISGWGALPYFVGR